MNLYVSQYQNVLTGDTCLMIKWLPASLVTHLACGLVSSLPVSAEEVDRASLAASSFLCGGGSRSLLIRDFFAVWKKSTVLKTN